MSITGLPHLKRALALPHGGRPSVQFSESLGSSHISRSAFHFSAKLHLSVISVLCLILVISAFLLSPDRTSANTSNEVRRVLILNDLNNISSPGFEEVDRALVSGLQKSSFQIELYQESLEVSLFPDDIFQQQFRKEFIRKYSQRKPDLIISAGTSSFEFIAGLQDSLLGTIPMVFCAVLEEFPDHSKHNTNFTGVLGRLHPQETLNVALRMLPATKHVVVVGGEGKFDEAWERIVKYSLQSYESKLEITYLTDLTMPALLERLGHLPSDTIVYHTAITRDATGTHFIDSAQSIPLVVGAANAPVFVIDDVNLRAGTVGGDLVNWANDASVAAEMAVRILSGEKPADIPVVTSKDAYMFDWRALRRWKLENSNLPPGSMILNRELSLWERTKWIWGTGLLIILFLSSLTAYLHFSRGQLKAARDAQLALSGLLIGAQDKERSRLAAELHDDFSQRLALLALGIEEVSEALSPSAETAKQQLHELLDSASEIGADLHNVSHRLHSSTLEGLGLAVGVSALCKEFTARNGIKVEYFSENVPRSVNPDVALCLFRIVQEGLQNLRKHSGASRAQVTLRKVGERLLVSMQDDGKGFDTKELEQKVTLGVRSMQERARLFRGQFEIHSEPGKGTRIEVWVPFQAAHHATA